MGLEGGSGERGLGGRPLRVLTFSPRGAPDLGPFEVVNLPLLELVLAADEEEVREALEWAEAVAFTSPSGVKMLFETFPWIREMLKGKEVIAIGPKTAEALREFGVEAKLPEEFHSASLAEALSAYKRVVAFRSDKASRTLKDALGGKLREVVIYKTVRRPREEVCELLEGVDAVVISSAEIGRAFVESLRLCGKGVPEGVKVVAIGPESSKALRELGVEHVVADEATFEGVRRKLEELFRAPRTRP